MNTPLNRGSSNLPRMAVLLMALLLLIGCGGEQAEHQQTTERQLTAVMDLDSTTIAAFTSEGTPAILEFGGKRCVSCMQMRSNFETLRESRPALRVGYVYWEDSPELFETWEIGLIPVQVVIDGDGRERDRHVGVWEVEEMEAALTRVLPRTPSR